MTAPAHRHRELAAGRWQTLSLAEQLGNVGSEVGRMRGGCCGGGAATSAV
jgi:hypothetical protein